MADYKRLEAWRVARDKVSRVLQHMEKKYNLPENMVDDVSEGIEELENI
jgi:hypothetical protein